MKNKKTNSFSFLDFIVKIANECFFANGSTGSPYDVNFTNHYNALYDVEKTIDEKGKVIPNKVVMNKKTKSIEAAYDEVELSSNQLNDLKKYCYENNIEYKTNGNKLTSININKNTTGVIDDRNWKKEIK